MIRRHWGRQAAVLALLGASIAPTLAQKPPKPDPQMKAVLDTLASLGGKPIEKLSAAEARKQPGPPQAVKALLEKQGKPTTPEPVGSVKNMKIPGPAGQIPVVVYTPSGSGPFPVLVYFHGGGWVIASPQAYDSSARALANGAKCVVVSVDYRMAPEHKFPAAHEDSYAALQYVMNHTAAMGGDPKRVAVGGESAGGNLATATCLMARDRKGKMPIHQLLVYPITNYAFDTPSYKQNAKAKPLNRAMMMWFFQKYLRTPADGRNPYVSPLRADVKGLPPATVIAAEIDPLRSEGRAYYERLRRAGVPASYRIYQGVTHEFFGMKAVVTKAKLAEDVASYQLHDAFSGVKKTPMPNAR